MKVTVYKIATTEIKLSESQSLSDFPPFQSQQVDAEVVISFVDPIRGSLELPLTGTDCLNDFIAFLPIILSHRTSWFYLLNLDEDKPFLLTLYVITLTGEKVTDEVIDLFATDQTDRSFTPRNLAFPLTLDRVPVTFNIRGREGKDFCKPSIGIVFEQPLSAVLRSTWPGFNYVMTSRVDYNAPLPLVKSQLTHFEGLDGTFKTSFFDSGQRF